MVYEFRCASPVCKTHFQAPTEAEIMGALARHVADAHEIPNPSKSLVAFLRANTIVEVNPTAKTG